MDRRSIKTASVAPRFPTPRAGTAVTERLLAASALASGAAFGSHAGTASSEKLLAVALVTAACWASAPIAAWALPEDAERPIHIRSESAEIERQEGRIVYDGGVRVEQGTLRVIAERMVVDADDGKVVRITATGTPARYRQQLEDGAGQVEADASTIVYHTRLSRIDLQGDAHLEQRGNSLRGDLIRYDIVTGRVAAGAPNQGPVQTTLMPAERNR